MQTYGERNIDHGDENGTDITSGNEFFGDLNGDGYPNIDDFAVFVQNSKNYIRSLLGTPDIMANIEFDAYIVFLPSNQAGTDVIDDTGEGADVKLIDADTRFGNALLLARSLLSIDYTLANQTLDLHAPERDLRPVATRLSANSSTHALQRRGILSDTFLDGHPWTTLARCRRKSPNS